MFFGVKRLCFGWWALFSFCVLSVGCWLLAAFGVFCSSVICCCFLFCCSFNFSRIVSFGCGWGNVGVSWFMGIGVSSIWFKVVSYRFSAWPSCILVLFISCVSYRILRYLPNLYKCLGTCSFNFTHWYIRVPVVKYLFLCLIPG